MTTAEIGLRERKKQKTRRQLSEIALRLFVEKGVDATTVDEICEEAEVSVSTFFRYFPSKEAAAFPDEEAKVEVVSDVLESAPDKEPLHKTIRRAALALIDYDLMAKAELHKWHELLRDEPSLAAYGLRLQTTSMETFTNLIARRMGVDPVADVRPGLAVGMAYAAVNRAWSTWTARGSAGDIRDLINEVFDVLDGGLKKALA
jgi:AcrR family transcriptional regulator